MMTTNEFDAAYVHLFRMAPYVANHSHLYRIVDLTDVISREISRSLPYRGFIWRLIYRLERPRIQRYECLVARISDETWLISEADRRVLTAACPTANIRVVGNGVDFGRFYPTGQPPEPDSLIFVGHLGVFHNVDAAVHLARDILPLVRRRMPDCQLRLVGAHPARQVQRLADDPAVTVTGFVPDLNSVLNQSAVFVAPLRFAAGVQNKVLEAMATARPVVTTSVVNAGLGAQAGEEVLVGEDLETIAHHIVTLLRNEELRTRIGQAGLCFVQQKYTWDHVVERMREIEQSLAVKQFGTNDGGTEERQ
jgi:glycosyltransferase involved in cell wall biosynthesis